MEIVQNYLRMMVIIIWYAEKYKTKTKNQKISRRICQEFNKSMSDGFLAKERKINDKTWFIYWI